MPVSKKARVSDQYDLEARLEKIIHWHLSDMEQNPEMYAAKDRLSAIQYVGMYLNRKYGWGEPEEEGVGASVRKYARAAFQTPPSHGVGTRTAAARSAAARPALVPTDTSEPEDTAA